MLVHLFHTQKERHAIKRHEGDLNDQNLIILADCDIFDDRFNSVQ